MEPEAGLVAGQMAGQLLLERNSRAHRGERGRVRRLGRVPAVAAAVRLPLLAVGVLVADGRTYPIVHAGSFKTLKEAKARRDLVGG